MDLNEINVFVSVVRAGSFNGAAKLLSIPKSTVSAKVAALERRLGVLLLQRTTRRLHVTEVGEQLFNACIRGLADIDAAEAQAAMAAHAPQGVLRVTASFDLGTLFMPGFLPSFLKKYPGLSVELLISGRVMDLVAEGVDVAIRSSNLKDSSLIARKLITTPFKLYASSAYLAEAGTPKQPKDLLNHRCVRHLRTQRDHWELKNGKSVQEITATGFVAADEFSVVKQMVIAGMGIGLIPKFIAEPDLAAGRLKAVLPGWYSSYAPSYLVYPSHRYQHPKVKVFIEEVSEALIAFLA